MKPFVEPDHRFVTRVARHPAGFTMIEIAISLAIIGFALVAIIGILPAGMSVQKENREETIINQDATIFMNAIRNGERGLDDLTNYVIAITNIWTDYEFRRGPVSPAQSVWYTPTASSTTPSFPLTNGFRILGLLSTPRITLSPNYASDRGFRSNYIVAIVRSISGPASEKFPQKNPAVHEMALTYRMLPAIMPYSWDYYDPSWTNYLDQRLYTPSTNALEISRRKDFRELVKQHEANLHDIRLTFRWPVLPNGIGNGRQVFRTTVTGSLAPQYEFGFTNIPFALYSFNPRNYVKAQ